MVTITKPKDADFQLKGLHRTSTGVWTMKVRDGVIDIEETPFGYTTRERMSLPQELKKPLYDLLGSHGSPAFALIYKEYLKKGNPFVSTYDFPDLSTERLISQLVYMIIYEPEKLIWNY